MRAIALGGATVAASSSRLQAYATDTAAIDGTTTTQGGLPLNGMCGVLYDAKATTQPVFFSSALDAAINITPDGTTIVGGTVKANS